MDWWLDECMDAWMGVPVGAWMDGCSFCTRVSFDCDCNTTQNIYSNSKYSNIRSLEDKCKTFLLFCLFVGFFVVVAFYSNEFYYHWKN